jgi:hypothetical protein
MAGCEPERFIGHPDRTHIKFPADAQQHPEKGRMQVKVFVDVDMIQGQTGAGKRGELRADLRLQLPPDSRHRKVPQTAAPHPPVHASGRIGEFRNQPRFEHRITIRQHHMQTHPKIGQGARAADSIRGGRRPDHQARGRQYAGSIRLFDRVIDGVMQAEVVGGDDEEFFRPRRDQTLTTGSTEPSRFTRK